MNKSPEIGELVKALAAARAEFAPLKKTAENPYYASRYAPLDEVIAATAPALCRHGLCVVQSPSGDTLTTLLAHTSGQWVEDSYPLHAVPMSRKGDATPDAPITPQAYGSAVTYARRYALCAVLNIAGEDDDDGNAVSGPAPSATPPKPQGAKAIPAWGDMAPPCKICGKDCRRVSAGVSKNGTPYNAFWACPDKCRGGSWNDDDWALEKSMRAKEAAEKAGPPKGTEDDIPF